MAKAESASQLFIARQPILDREFRPVGYELLFRSGQENLFTHTDGDQASLSVLGTSLCEMGLDRLTGGGRAYINFTRELLLNGFASLLPKERVVIEILEGIQPRSELLQQCRELKNEGYALALDDVRTLERGTDFADLVEIVKVDFQRTDRERQARIAEVFVPKGVTLLAEKVETHEDQAEAQRHGYQLFQGYYYCRPRILVSPRVPVRNTLDFLLLREAYNPQFSYDRLETIVKQDPMFTLKLLRYLNSAFFGLSQPVHSIRQALVMLGQKKLRRWVAVLLATGFSRCKPALLSQAVVRARFCENLAPLCGRTAEVDELFLVGLFSLLDAITDQSRDELLASVNVAPEIKDAILGRESLFSGVLELACAYESADWVAMAALTVSLGIDENKIPRLHEEALQWAYDLISIAEVMPELAPA